MWSVLIYSKNSHFQFQNFFSHDTNAFDNWFPCIQSDNCTCSHPNYCWCMCHHFDIGWGWECTARLQLLGVKLWKLNLAKVFSSTNYFHFFHFKLIFWQNNFTKKSLFGLLIIVWASSFQLSCWKFFFKVKYFKKRWQDSFTLSEVFKNVFIFV